MKYAVIDLETTGLKPSSDCITEIGCMVVEDGVVVAQVGELEDVREGAEILRAADLNVVPPAVIVELDPDTIAGRLAAIGRVARRLLVARPLFVPRLLVRNLLLRLLPSPDDQVGVDSQRKAGTFQDGRCIAGTEQVA